MFCSAFLFVGVMQFTTQAVIERRRDLEPGDVILVNDPYLGGTHLMDVKMVRPERDIARGYYTDEEAVRLFTRATAAE